MRILTPLHNPARLQPQISHCQLLFHTALKSLTHLPLNSLHSERLDSHTGFLPYSKEDRRKEDNPHRECPTRSPFSLQQVLKQPGALAHPLCFYPYTTLPPACQSCPQSQNTARPSVPIRNTLFSRASLAPRKELCTQWVHLQKPSLTLTSCGTPSLTKSPSGLHSVFPECEQTGAVATIQHGPTSAQKPRGSILSRQFFHAFFI